MSFLRHDLSVRAGEQQRLLRIAISFIAFNDDYGADDALDIKAVSKMMTVVLVSEVFELSSAEVAEMVVGARKRAEGVPK